MDRAKHDRSDERTPKHTTDDDLTDRDDLPTDEVDDVEANPPRTTTKHMTSPKFGSAGSGGAELEPGPPRP